MITPFCIKIVRDQKFAFSNYISKQHELDEPKIKQLHRIKAANGFCLANSWQLLSVGGKSFLHRIHHPNFSIFASRLIKSFTACLGFLCSNNMR